MTHDNHNWHHNWAVDLKQKTATHIDGWAFVFKRHNIDGGGWDGVCIKQPKNLTQEQIFEAQKIATEAGQIWTSAAKAKNEYI